MYEINDNNAIKVQLQNLLLGLPWNTFIHCIDNDLVKAH